MGRTYPKQTHMDSRLTLLLLLFVLSSTAHSARPVAAQCGQTDETRNEETTEQLAEPALGPGPIAAEPAKRQTFFEAYWDEGVKYRIRYRFRELDSEPVTIPFLPGRFTGEYVTGSVGVRLQTDAAGYVERAGLAKMDDKIGIRRAFVRLGGDFFLLKPVHFHLEVGVITQKAYLDTAYIEIRDLRFVKTFRFGQFDGPMSLEQLGSSRDTVLMERGAAVQAFAPGLKTGLQIGRTFLDERMTFALGWFANAANLDTGDSSSSLARVIGRLTWLTAERGEPDPDHFLHLGFSLGWLFASDDVRYQSRPESFFANVLVNTGDIDAKSALVFGTELAWVKGPNLVQAEYLHSFVTGAPGGGVNFPGMYVLASRLLTGEHHPYNRRSGTLGQVVPNRSFAPRHGGWGAWEVAARFSHLDLEDGRVKGGIMNLMTLGMNWYWSRYIRWQVNYIFSGIDNTADDGRLHVFQGRFQLAF